MFMIDNKIETWVIRSWVTDDELVIVEARAQVHRDLLHHGIYLGMHLKFSLTPLPERTQY